MMEEICAHIMDIAANAVTAGATHVAIAISKDRKNNLLSIAFKDDGRGMNEEMVKKVIDPFFSTKKGKKVGLGIPLLKGTAETCGGKFSLTSKSGEGVDISVSFQLDHPDLPPLGNLKETILVLIMGNQEVDFSFFYSVDGQTFSLHTREIRELIGAVPINHPEIVKFLTEFLDEKLQFI
ncbi:MAG: ATP-binding protein [Syntrophobacterales bacterium]|jgi:anti-sigma regulatory factor (Ser/Thr protein kinase)|nr:ATP-binding protein [Syntrophobacterales bacterium]